MRFWCNLRKFNTVSFALLMLAALVLLLVSGILALQDWNLEGGSVNSTFYEGNEDAHGDIVNTKNGKFAVYWRGDISSEWKKNIHFVDLKNGGVYKFSDDPGQIIFQGNALSADDADENSVFGYTGLAQVSEANAKPGFDLVAIRFSDMKRFVLAKNISAVDGLTVLDSTRVSYVAWDSQKQAKFEVFDFGKAQVTLSRAIDLGAEPASDMPRAAPRNKFGD